MPPRHLVAASLVLACGAGLLAQASGSGNSASPAGAQSPPPQASTPPRGQPTPGMPPVTFRVQVEYVEVDAIVTDRTGQFVRDLTRDDFQVLEDGKPQKVELFSIVDIPVERADRVVVERPPVEPDVRINDRFEGRMVVIVLDDLHTHPLRSVLVKRAARQFIERHLGANDLAAVVHTSGRTDAGQEFTSNKRLLLDAVDRFMGNKVRSRALNRMDEYQRQRQLPRDSALTRADILDPDDQIRAYQARSAMDTLRSVATYMEGVRGRRKAVLFISEGIDYDVYNVFEAREASTVFDSVRDAIGAATRSNVAFYTIDPRGLTTMGDDSIEMTGFADDPGLGVGPEAFGEELRLAQDSLRVLAEQTGGLAAVNSNDFATAFDRVVRDNSSYYVLGYYPTNPRRDGRYRKIDVRVTRPGLEVRARKGYVAPKGKAEPRFTTTDAGTAAETSAVLREALNSPLPEPDLPMGVTAAAFKGPESSASVLVVTQLAGRQLRFAGKDGKFLNTIELSMIAIDAQGKIRNGDRSKIDLALSPQTHQAVLAGGFRMLTRLDLPPGRYQLRLAARESGGLVGSLPYDLVVPDFSKEPMSISGLVITSLSSAMTPTARSDEQLKDVLPGPPSVMRDFVQGDTLSLFAEVYDNDTKSPHRVDILTTLIGEDGRQAFKIEDERNSSELQGARGGYGYTAKIPLADVAPGRYLLRVEARSRLRSDAPVSRETEIRVYQVRRPASPSASAAPAGRAIVPVELGPMSGVNEYREVIARTPDEWADLWKSLPVRRAMPKVTFESTMIAGLFLGERSSAGYGVEFTAVKRDGDTLVIEYVERKPGADTTAAQMITTPFFIAGVPKHDGPVKFVRVEP